jgi:hypothetical protein
MYGAAPPAVGLLLLKGPNNKYTNPPKQLDLTSFDLFSNSDKVPPCEEAPNPDPMGAYYFMQGYKRDSTCWLDPTQLITQPNFYKKTKFLWPGDPETNIGWTEYKGEVQNCGHDSSGTPVIPYPPGDMLLLMNSGTENLTVMPGDTQTIVLCQLIAKGTSNLNSVTKLKQLADFAREFYNSGYTIGIKNLSSEVPTKFNLEQNYPNPFNPTTKIKFDIPSHLSFPNASIGNPFVSLKIYDVLGREIQTLVNEKLQPGSYEVTFNGSNLSSGIYFYQLKAGEYIENKKMVLIK